MTLTYRVKETEMIEIDDELKTMVARCMTHPDARDSDDVARLLDEKADAMIATGDLIEEGWFLRGIADAVDGGEIQCESGDLYRSEYLQGRKFAQQQYGA